MNKFNKMRELIEFSLHEKWTTDELLDMWELIDNKGVKKSESV